MKRLFSLLTLAFLAASAWAQYWTPKTNQDYPDDNLYYVSVYLNGMRADDFDNVEVAAFINGECRASGTVSSQRIATLRVAGNLASESGKNISFKVRYRNLNYAVAPNSADLSKAVFTSTATTKPSSPLKLYVDAISDVKMENPIEVNAPATAFPYELNLMDKVNYVYGDTSYVPKKLSVCETQLTTSCQVLDPVMGSTVSGFSYNNGILTIEKPVEGSFNCSFRAYTTEGNFVAGITSTLNVKLDEIPVTNMTVSRPAFGIFTNDNLKDLLKEYVTITPNNATYNDFTLSLSDTLNRSFNGEKFSKGGNYEVIIKSTDPKYYKTLEIDVNVMEHPCGISGPESDLKVGLGDYVDDAVMKNIVLAHVNNIASWFYDDSLDIKVVSGAEFMDDAHVAKKTGTVVYEVRVKNGLTDKAFTTVYPSDAVTVKVNIVSNLKVFFTVGNAKFFKNGQPSTLTPVVVSVSNPQNEPFDKNLLAISFPDRYTGFPYAEMVSVDDYGYNEMGAPIAYSFTILPKFVGRDIAYKVTYDGQPVEQMGDPSLSSMPAAALTIAGVENLEQGWNWMAVNNIADPMIPMSVESVFPALNDIEQVRSQKLSVFNDSEWGLFGDLKSITPADAMYKVNALNATTVNLGSFNCFETEQAVAEFKKGYNWTNNPCEFDVVPSQLNQFLGFTPSDGDIIITQEGFASYGFGNWVADSTFCLKAGKGFIYFLNEDKSMTASGLGNSIKPTKDDPSAAGKRNVKRINNFFNYDVHAFADKMAMIARVEGLTDAENYEVGVFVDDDCRGMGKVVANNILFINAVGEKGEMMTLKLYNKQTGELSDIDEVVTCEQVKGSLAAPTTLHAPQTTGIRSIGAGKQQADSNTYDLSGRRVERAAKGLYIKNGKAVLVK